MTQPDQTTLARKWKLDVNTGTVAAPVWTSVKGIAEAKVTPFTATMEDDNVYEDSGYTSATKTALTFGVELKLVRRVAPGDDTSYDTGQQRLRTLAKTLGASGVGYFRVYDREGGAEAWTFFAEVNWEPDGGSATDLEKVTVTLRAKGAPTEITNPDTTSPPTPTVDALSPSTGPAAGGTLVKVTGTGFIAVSGATGVKFGATNATSYFVQDANTIYAVAPAQAAGTVNVTVTNTTGTSATTGTGNDYIYT